MIDPPVPGDIVQLNIPLNCSSSHEGVVLEAGGTAEDPMVDVQIPALDVTVLGVRHHQRATASGLVSWRWVVVPGSGKMGITRPAEEVAG